MDRSKYVRPPSLIHDLQPAPPRLEIDSRSHHSFFSADAKSPKRFSSLGVLETRVGLQALLLRRPCHNTGSGRVVNRLGVFPRRSAVEIPVGLFWSTDVIAQTSRRTLADSQGTLADVELGGPGCGGKANSQTRSSASPNVINVLYAGPRPMLPMNGLSGANVGAGCDCHPAQRPCSPRMF